MLHSERARTVSAAILISTAALGLSPFGLMGNRPSAIMSRAVLMGIPCNRQYSASGKYGVGMMIVMLGLMGHDLRLS